jgi:hypothetical protein
MRLRGRLVAAAGRATDAVPLYRLLPPGGVRSYAGLRYHRHDEEQARPPDDLGHPERVRNLPAALAAARKAVQQGHDEVAQGLLSAASAHQPEAAGTHLVRADLASFHGDHAGALEEARQALALDPASAAAAARVVLLLHLLGSADADAETVQAVGRFPRSLQVLWVAGKACHSAERYRLLMSTWREAARPTDLARCVAPLATAAARAGLIPEAVALHLEALLTSPGGAGAAGVVSEPRLEGRGAWSALRDLRSAFDEAGIPFFFAAGTALGLVREGRPLDLDGDIDVGVLAEDFDREALVEVFRLHPAFAIDLDHPHSQKLRLKHRGGSPIDVFLFYEEGGRIWHDGVFVRWWNRPFGIERLEVRGERFPIPEGAERYLTDSYGDWRTPEPGFDAFVDAPNLEVTWPEYLALHRARRAYRALVSGDLRTGNEELSAIDDTMLAAALRVLATDPSGVTASPAPPVSAGPSGRLDVAVALVRHVRHRGDRGAAAAALVRAIEAGGWLRPRLWAELLSLMEQPSDYLQVRSLWLASPAACRSNISIVRTVARAACVAGEHEEGRALLRLAIVEAARQRRVRRQRPWLLARSVAGRVRRTIVAPPSDRSSFEQDAREALVALHRELEPLGVRAFLISGTLLGYVREGDFIAWDKDIDLGVFSEEIDTSELQARVETWPSFTVKRLDWTARLRLDHDNGTKIDVFPHYREGPDRVWHDGTATRWWNTPFGLRTVPFLGIDQAIPDDPERYLDENYGDWRTPDPRFDARLDAPNREITDRAYFDSLQYFSLLDAILRGDRWKEGRYRGLLHELGEGHWLDGL